ncbi:hypothetical protein JW911_04100 [Candidatus Peregrinibacteria bacterium]|nr:hypothetical protein [Candidatus Peregrinibacteria bacterium]
MAEENTQNQGQKKNVIDLSKAMNNEQATADTGTNEDILAREAELLGPTPQGAGAASSAAKPGAGQPAGAKPAGTAAAAAKFNIPAVVKDHYPALIPLILETESMDDQERDYWFQMLPIMTDEQIDKLKEILLSEKEQLAKLDADYEAELKKIDEKHLQEWKQFEQKQKTEEIQKKEAAAQVQEQETEEELLNKLQNL